MTPHTVGAVCCADKADMTGAWSAVEWPEGWSVRPIWVDMMILLLAWLTLSITWIWYEP